MQCDDLNFATLQGEDEYARYFNQLSSIFQLVLKSYQVGASGELVERTVVANLFQRLLMTIEVLRIKYSYLLEHERSLWIDLTESGFPNFAELNKLNVDVVQRHRRRLETPTMTELKRDYLDQLFGDLVEPRAALRGLCERTCLDMSEPATLFLPFTFGNLELHIRKEGSQERVRLYTVSWGSYDFVTNRPYLHLMTLEQDADRPALEEPGEDRDQFLRVLEHEGTRASDVGVVAAAIDEALETIHPRILKRICIGPLYSRFLLQGRKPNFEDSHEVAIRALMELRSGDENDFILFLTDEIIFSKRQEITRSLFAPQGRVRQVFSIPESDPEAYVRRASVVHHSAMLPHLLLQLLNETPTVEIPGFADRRLITFDERGSVHGI